MKFIRKRKYIIVFSFLFIICLSVFFITKLYNNHQVYTNLNYCNEIAKEYSWLKLKQFRCCSIDEWNNSTVSFNFELKNVERYNYNEDESIKDIGKIKNKIKEYMIKNQNNELHNKKIVFTFETWPGDISYMYNYDYRLNESESTPSDFLYYEKLYTKNISSLECLQNAKVMDVSVQNLDDFNFLSDWSNLEYFNIWSINMTEKDKDYLKDIIYNCNIICNDEILKTT